MAKHSSRVPRMDRTLLAAATPMPAPIHSVTEDTYVRAAVESLIREASLLANAGIALLRVVGYLPAANAQPDPTASVPTVCPTLLVKLGMAVRLRQWKNAGINLAQYGLPTGDEVLEDLQLRPLPSEQRYPTAALLAGFLEMWRSTLGWTDPIDCGLDSLPIFSVSVGDSTQLGDNAFLDAVADFLWSVRHLTAPLLEVSK